MTKRGPFKYFHSSPEIIRLAVMLYVRFPLSLRNVEDHPRMRCPGRTDPAALADPAGGDGYPSADAPSSA